MKPEIKSSNKEVVVAIITYNSWPIVARCLSALKEDMLVSKDVLVIDNASPDGTPFKIQEQFPDITVYRSDQNILYTNANNLVLQICKDTQSIKYVVLLNADVKLESSTLSKIVDFMERNIDVGITGPKLIRENGVIDWACRRSRPTYWDIWVWIFGLNKILPKSKLFGHYNLTYLNPDDVIDVDAISGACMVIRNSLLSKVGLLDDIFPMYGSDIDYCLRAKANNWRVVYYPIARAIHTKHASSKSRPRWSTSQFYDEFILLYQRYIGSNKNSLLNMGVIGALLLRKKLHLLKIKRQEL